MKRGRGLLIRLDRLLPLASAIAVSLALAVLSHAQTAESYRQQAAELARTKSWNEAIATYRKALELAPNDAVSHYELGLALKNNGAARQAVEELEATIKLKPDWADARYALGATLYELHELPSALKELTKAAQ